MRLIDFGIDGMCHVGFTFALSKGRLVTAGAYPGGATGDWQSCLHMSGTAVAILGRSVVYQSDLKLVCPGQWFNDSLIHYAFEVLSAELGPEAPLVLVPPQAAFVLLHENDDDDFRDTISGVFRPAPVPSANASDTSCSLASPSARFRSCAALFPLNNSAARQGATGGGDHWTALLWLPARREWLFLDSHAGAVSCGSGAGARDAHRAAVDSLARRVASALGSDGSGGTEAATGVSAYTPAYTPATAAAAAPAAIAVAAAAAVETAAAHETFVVDAAYAGGVVARLPQQSNSSDCGPFVVQWARVIAAAVSAAAAAGAGAAAAAPGAAAPGVAALTAAMLLPALARGATAEDAAAVRHWLASEISGAGAA